MNEIILFCYGDSTKSSTWSNVPYLMAKSLEKHGITVRRINIAPNKKLHLLANKFFALIDRSKCYSYSRTRLFQYLTEKKIRRAVEKYDKADFCIFLNFDFYNKFNSIPSLLFSDWTYKILIEERMDHIPVKPEQRFMKQQETAINNADIVLPLFSESVEKMRASYPRANIKDIGYNVINNLYEGQIDADTLIRQKYDSNCILFIGRLAYMEGLKSIVDAVGQSDIRAEIHVVGISRHEMPDAPDFVKFHGYLNKDNPDENREYYDLVKKAKIIANPTPKWAGYSSVVEGMYFYTPVVIYPFNQFVKEFGSDIDFGFYNDGTVTELGSVIENIFSMPYSEYCGMATKAHERVKDYTWDNYVSDMIDMMSRAAGD